MKSKSRRLGGHHQLARLLILALTLSAFVFCLLLPTGNARSEVLGTNGKIAFVNSGIVVMNPDGTGQINLGGGGSPTWSPDGSRIAFTGRGEYGLEVYVMNYDGSKPRQLTFANEYEENAYDPAWSPDGKTIMFLSSGHIYTRIEFMDGNGDVQSASDPPLYYLGKPAWSPDGTRIAFIGAGIGSSSPHNLYVLNANGSGLTYAANNALFFGRVAWSPDGSKILYPRMVDGFANLYLVGIGGLPTPLTSGPHNDTSPVWSPDGSLIAFDTDRNPNCPTGTSCSEIFLMNADGGNQRPIASQPVLGTVYDWQSLTPKQMLPPAPATLQLEAPVYRIGESNGSIRIKATRLGDLSGEASVDFATSDGTARARSDYTPIFRSLRFAPSEGEKAIVIPITNNAYVQGDRTVNLTLSNPKGAPFGPWTAAVLTIVEDDVSLPTTNPVDATQFFVSQHYDDFLNRVSDLNGLTFWTNQINSCFGNQQCIEQKRVNVSAAFFLSIEFQQTGFLVERIYKAAYGDATVTSTLGGGRQLAAPIIRFDEFLPDTQQIGQDLIVGQSGWQTVLENNKQNFISEFVQRPRFTLAYPTFMTPVQFVDSLFANAGVVPTALERQAAITEFNGAASSADNAARARALRRVAENHVLAQREFNRAFVLMEYFGYLRRNPNEGQDRDYTGYDFWLTKLNEFNGDYQKSEMVKGFISSTEYRQRFGP